MPRGGRARAGCWCRTPEDGRESGKEKGDAGCEGREVLSTRVPVRGFDGRAGIFERHDSAPCETGR